MSKILNAVLIALVMCVFSCNNPYEEKNEDITIYVKPEKDLPPKIWIWQKTLNCSEKMGYTFGSSETQMQIAGDGWYKYTIKTHTYQNDYIFHFKLNEKEYRTSKAGAFKFDESTKKFEYLDNSH